MAAKKARPHMTERAMLELLRVRYPSPEWAFFEQVRNAAGFEATRTADAVAMNLWPSRGLMIHGFEVKVSRRDWLTELRKPEKAEAVAKFCDFWWLVVPDPEIVRDELPAGWGLLAPHGRGLRAYVDAPQSESVEITRSFLGALLKRAQDVITDEARLKAAHDEGVSAGLQQAEHRLAGLRDDVALARERTRESDRRLDEFRQLLGVGRGDYWMPDSRLKEAIQFALTANVGAQVTAARRVAAQLREQADALDGRLDEIGHAGNGVHAT